MNWPGSAIFDLILITGLLPSASTVLGMPSPKPVRRRKLPRIVAAVVQPVAKRLSRMEALLIEMRNEQDVQLKRVTALLTQLNTLTEQVQINSRDIRRIAPRKVSA